ncbi:UNVERIFIED_CONTAM: Autophagy-related protein 18f [Sesamum calycinum]|uniref:Autophagy-related protein 18f n=1 Tax=Sesamum calycinum TaxID=2727403 RepID=A0AAW2Q3F4_9LAMI
MFIREVRGLSSVCGLLFWELRGSNGIIPNSFKALSSYLRVVSSGASTVASTVRSAASAASSAIVERDGDANHDQGVSFSLSGVRGWRLLTSQNRLFAVVECSGIPWRSWIGLLVIVPVVRRYLLSPVVSLLTSDICFNDLLQNLLTRILAFRASVAGGPILSSSVAFHIMFYLILIQFSVSVSWAGFDKLELERGSTRQILLLGFSYGFQVWDVEVADNVCNLVSRHDGPVSFLQLLPNPLVTKQSGDNFADSRPLLVICADGSFSGGCGPLAVGPRWMAYSGSQVAISNSGRVSPQHLTSSPTFPCPASNGSLVAHYAKESSRQLAAGIVTLGDMGYKKLSRYYSELLPEGNNGQSGTARVKVHDIVNGHSPDAENVGMVIVRDIVSKTVIAQFRAHKSPILSLCFDPSGSLLVTASVQGHNINVFRIMPGNSGGSGAASGSSYVHLYRLQRGLTNAVIQDISFSCDSKWIMISSLRGTSHLFAISPSGGLVNFQSSDAFVSTRGVGPSSTTKPAVRGSPSSGLQVLTQQDICASGPTVTLSAVSRIKNGNNGWRNTVSGAAAAATGWSSSLCGAIASTFHNCKGNDMHGDSSSLNRNYYLLVFSPGSMTQYILHFPPAYNGMRPGVSVTSEPSFGYDARLMVKAIQMWNICQKQNCKERGDNIDAYAENGNPDSSKVYPEKMKCENDVFSDVLGTATKEKITMEEKHHMHISEAELQMHQNQNPLWARSEIYFQSMLTDALNIKEDGACGGEIEIERVPTRMLEARSRGLVPVFDYLQTPKSQKGRISVTDGDNNGHIEPQGSDVSEYGKLAGRNSSGSLDSMANAGIIDGEYSLHDKGQDGLQFTETSGGFVNTNDTPIVNARLDNVNTRDNSVTESQLRSVHTIDGLKVENQSAEGDEFD